MWRGGGWTRGSDVATRGGGGATQRHGLRTCHPDGAQVLLEEDAATVTKLLFVRLITKGRKIVVCLFVGSCTIHPGVLGSIPKREEPGKTGRHPVLKYRVPHGSHGKSSRPAGLSILVYAYVVDCAPAYPYAYSSSTHRFPDERTPIEAMPLSATSAELGLDLGLG
jgi:hypothetical protein